MALLNKKPFALEDRDSLDGEQSWHQITVEITISRRKVTYEEAETFARNNGFDYYEVSALSGERVSEVFEKLTRSILNKVLNK